MPTGYTYVIQENPDIPFATFAWQCARAMGACVMQRDDPGSEPPRMDEPSDYSQKQLDDAREKLLVISTMGEDEAEASALRAYQEECERIDRILAEIRRTEAGYRRMLANIEEWNPPTEEHVGLKDFMLQQVRDSIKWDCDTSYYDKPVDKLTGEQWRRQQIDKLNRDIEYHTKAYAEEVERTRGRNEWKRQLAESLGVSVNA